MSRRFRLFAVFVLLHALVTAAPAVAVDATPAAVLGATAAARLYVGQSARLTALIPADWSADPSAAVDYAGPDGFVGSEPIPGAGLSLDGACAQEAANPRFGTAPREQPATWHSESACRVDAAAGTVAGLVVPDPRPFTDWAGEVAYVAVYADPAHLTAVAATLDFSPDRVTPATYLSRCSSDSARSAPARRPRWPSSADHGRAPSVI